MKEINFSKDDEDMTTDETRAEQFRDCEVVKYPQIFLFFIYL